MSADPRSRRVAVVAEAQLEELLPELQARGYGTIQLPPAGLSDDVVSDWLDQVAEHVAEFVRNDYEVVLADDGASAAALRAKLAELGVGELATLPR